MQARSAEECDAIFGRCLNAADLEGLVALYEPSATLVNQDRSLARGLAAIRDGLAGFVAMRPTITMNVSAAIPAGDDLCALYNDWTLTAKGPDGSDIVLTGKAIELVRRQPDGTWLFALDDPFARG